VLVRSGHGLIMATAAASHIRRDCGFLILLGEELAQ
jgi:hypothetical protein